MGPPSQDHAAVISYLDAKVGDLLERLKSLKIDEKTLVFFASDNGAHQEGGHQIASWNWDELGRTGTNWDEQGLESWEFMAIFMGFSGHFTIITGDNLWDIKPFSWDISEDIPMI